MADTETRAEADLSTEQVVEPVKEAPKVPEPTATGNQKVAILSHGFSHPYLAGDAQIPAGVDLVIRNVSDRTIATMIFEADFYDREGKIWDTVKHKESELKPETSRRVHFTSSILTYDRDKVQSYAVRIKRMATADAEKIQFVRYGIRTTETGEEEVAGIVKNISTMKTDAGVTVTFRDPEDEIIGTRIIVFKDFEPDTIREFDLLFKPEDGAQIGDCSLVVGEVVG